MASNELPRVRTELQNLLVVHSLAPHPVQAHPQSARHRYLGYALFPTHGQTYVPLFPLRVFPYGTVSCFHQQEAQQRIALLTDVPQPLTAGTGVLARNEPQVAADLLAATKTFRCPDDQNESQGRDRTNAFSSKNSNELK